MALGILAFGHGGGVPGPIHGTPVGASGNTNFALIPNIDTSWLVANNGWFGDPHPSRKGLYYPNSTSIAMRLLAKQPFWLIDCGPETTLRLCGVFGDTPCVKQLQGVFLTHLHHDHSGGLASLAYRAKYIEGTRPLLAYPEELYPDLKAQLGELDFLNPTEPNIGGMGGYFDFQTCDDSFRIGPDLDVKLTPFAVDHNLIKNTSPIKKVTFPAFGYTVETPHGTICFSGDTAHPISQKHMKEAKVVIHDVQFYAPHNYEKGWHNQSYVHCPYAVLRDAVPPEHRHKVWLTHTGHELPPEVIADGFAGLFRQGELIVL